MVEAYKNGKSVIIPYDTYKRIYAPNGWTADQETAPAVTADTEKPSVEMAALKKRAKKLGIDISEAATPEEAQEILEKAENL